MQEIYNILCAFMRLYAPLCAFMRLYAPLCAFMRLALDINRLLLDKLPDVLSEKQKENKIKNLLQIMKNEGLIEISGKLWKMSKSL